MLAVLDWELSTLGDPLADVAFSCLAHYLPSSFPVIKGRNCCLGRVIQLAPFSKHLGQKKAVVTGLAREIEVLVVSVETSVGMYSCQNREEEWV